MERCFVSCAYILLPFCISTICFARPTWLHPVLEAPKMIAIVLKKYREASKSVFSPVNRNDDGVARPLFGCSIVKI